MVWWTALRVLGWGAAAATVAVVAHEVGKEKGVKEGEQKATAKGAVKIKELEDEVLKNVNIMRNSQEEIHKIKIEIDKYYKNQHKFDQYIICLMSVGVAAAACNGEIHQAAIRDLREYVLGEVHRVLPLSVEEKIQQLLEHPPSFNQAMLYVEPLDQMVWPVIDNILAVVSEANGAVSQANQNFIRQWESYKTVKEALSSQKKLGIGPLLGSSA